MTTILLYLCFATVDASNENLKVTKLKIEKKEEIFFLGGYCWLETGEGEN